MEQKRGLQPNREGTLASTKVLTEVELDRANLDELAQVSMAVACDVIRGTITPKCAILIVSS